MIFVDSNVPMYLIGAEHPNKQRCREVLERLVAAGERLVTSAEVLEEVLHRYAAIGRLDAIAPAFELMAAISDEVFPVVREDVERARDFLLTGSRRSARDALHVAVMARTGVGRIFSFDSGFDGIEGIVRLS